MTYSQVGWWARGPGWSAGEQGYWLGLAGGGLLARRWAGLPSQLPYAHVALAPPYRLVSPHFHAPAPPDAGVCASFICCVGLLPLQPRRTLRGP